MTIEERCADFDAKHPHVYAEIKRLALLDLANQWDYTTVGYLAEQARRNLKSSGRCSQGFKVNHDFRRVWARRLIAEVPELAALIRTRTTRAA